MEYDQHQWHQRTCANRGDLGEVLPRAGLHIKPIWNLLCLNGGTTEPPAQEVVTLPVVRSVLERPTSEPVSSSHKGLHGAVNTTVKHSESVENPLDLQLALYSSTATSTRRLNEE